jgi:hypothetical protein
MGAQFEMPISAFNNHLMDAERAGKYYLGPKCMCGGWCPGDHSLEGCVYYQDSWCGNEIVLEMNKCGSRGNKYRKIVHTLYDANLHGSVTHKQQQKKRKLCSELRSHHRARKDKLRKTITENSHHYHSALERILPLPAEVRMLVAQYIGVLSVCNE